MPDQIMAHWVRPITPVTMIETTAVHFGSLAACWAANMACWKASVAVSNSVMASLLVDAAEAFQLLGYGAKGVLQGLGRGVVDKDIGSVRVIGRTGTLGQGVFQAR